MIKHKLLRKTSSYKFYLAKLNSPTALNLKHFLEDAGWEEDAATALFTEKNLEFPEQITTTLEYKHLLADLGKTECPDFMPLTYYVNDNNWPSILAELLKRFYSAREIEKNRNLSWILKPSLQNNGQNIKIFSTPAAIEQHFLSANRLGGDHVLQLYISKPHLLRDNRKYSIRIFMVLTNFKGIYLYPYGYFNVARHSYTENDFSSLSSHLTNEHLSQEKANVIQIPSVRFDFYPQIYRDIKYICTKLINGLRSNFPELTKTSSLKSLAFFGFDFLVDDQLKVWLLEANHGPCFPISDEHPLQNHLYKDFWKAVIQEFIHPLVSEQKSSGTTAFEAL